jgi:hypothetical protein
MSEPTASPASSAAATKPAEKSLFAPPRSWMIASVVAAIMILLALLGVGLTTASSPAAETYWISLVPIFGVLCIATAWARARPGQAFDRMKVFQQVLHWAGIGGALAIDFVIRGAGQETPRAAGLNALLLLALGCYLAGVHLEPLFVLVGLLLVLAGWLVVKAEQYEWLIFVVGGLSVAGMLGLRWMLGRQRAAPSG